MWDASYRNRCLWHKNLINHKKRFLCGTDSESISKAINTLKENRKLKEKISINAKIHY